MKAALSAGRNAQLILYLLPDRTNLRLRPKRQAPTTVTEDKRLGACAIAGKQECPSPLSVVSMLRRLNMCKATLPRFKCFYGSYAISPRPGRLNRLQL